ncbi:hypothetical protein D3P09_02195 [Paenibacillus pinisoli]|uniref:Hemolysin XhlA n=1 Tax=Paenibacillus pinisoli TaxID=1276110 RepID=A0A3A6PIB2_9BACL|nr:hemolysin XhlA family protein [Paenibacillus pinisoli]RJX40855.1 hypothetical protein D3P09_02195 [Paenibacillus pinisoli]
MPDMQNEMLQRMTRVETKVDGMDGKLDRAITANEMAVEARASASSAHKRIDKIEDNQKWIWRTMVGAVLVAVVAFIIGGGLKP